MKAITLISGTEIQTPKATIEYEEKKKEGEKGPESERVETSEEQKVKVENKEKATAAPIRPYEAPVTYPQRLMKKEYDQQFAKFLERFKTLHINVPIVECLAPMPKYAKFLKELISNKKKLEECEAVTLTKECSAVISNKLPLKQKQPGSITILYSVGNLSF